MAEKNYQLMIDTLRKIVAEPSKWDQSVWATDCGTSYCFAGHAALLVGGRQAKFREFLRERPEEGGVWSELVKLSPEAAERANVVPGDSGQETFDGELLWPMATVGRKALGLNYDEANILFCASNTIEVLYAIIRTWAGADGNWDAQDQLDDIWEDILVLRATQINEAAKKLAVNKISSLFDE